MEKLNHIRARVQLLLIVALLALTGALCRKQNAMRQQTSVTTVLTQSGEQHSAITHLEFLRSILASDLSGGIPIENYTKAQVTELDTAGWGVFTHTKPLVVALYRDTVPPPDAKKYYIFTYGKIRI